MALKSFYCHRNITMVSQFISSLLCHYNHCLFKIPPTPTFHACALNADVIQMQHCSRSVRQVEPVAQHRTAYRLGQPDLFVDGLWTGRIHNISWCSAGVQRIDDVNSRVPGGICAARRRNRQRRRVGGRPMRSRSRASLTGAQRYVREAHRNR